MEAYRLCFTLSATTKFSFRRPSPSQNPLKSISTFIPLSASITSTTQNPFFPPSPNKTFTKLCSTRRPESFDEAAFEAERLTLDAKARAAMADIADQETAMRSRDAESDGSVGEDEKAWKWRIRKRVWDLMEAENIAQNPRPVHHRIPNFVGAADAAKNLGGLEVFKLANCVKVNPDSPQKQVRFLTLSGGKKLLTPQPRLRTGFFSVLELSMLALGTINEACTSVGVAKHGKPIGLDEKIKVDLIVIGSVAVDPKTGARLGKGELNLGKVLFNKVGSWKKVFHFRGSSYQVHFSDSPSRKLATIRDGDGCRRERGDVCDDNAADGAGGGKELDNFLFLFGFERGSEEKGEKQTMVGFAELEYGMLRYMGAIDDTTPVVTSVHDRQLVDDIPSEKLLIHDVPVDIICTPTQVIFTDTSIPKPQGIYWEKLSPEKLSQIRILRELKRWIERETGTKLPCGPSEKLPPTAKRNR
ncbi:hypothetical protein Scep_002227 [Stephania cephalantha]|uniref:5-formyltetrahydrofolate cyclo-ligase-like protein COG0212 n=1 Tax=Stephania cephalantha TaxID=152367 RepID=A0AAP0Q8K1_9MAGN